MHHENKPNSNQWTKDPKRTRHASDSRVNPNLAVSADTCGIKSTQNESNVTQQQYQGLAVPAEHNSPLLFSQERQKQTNANVTPCVFGHGKDAEPRVWVHRGKEVVDNWHLANYVSQT